MAKPVLAAQLWPSNAELIADVHRLGYITGRVLDPTFEGGIWWQIHRPADLVTLHGPTDGTDFRGLHQFGPGSFDTIAYDPPYIPMGGKATSNIGNFNARFGRDVVPSSAESVQQLINDGLTEMWRLVRPGGIVLAKCADYVWNGDLWVGTHWTLTHALELGFMVEERFEMYSETASPQPKRSLCLRCGEAIQRRADHHTWTDLTRKTEPSTHCRRPWAFLPHRPNPAVDTQDHAARNLSTLFVLRKPLRRRPPQYRHLEPQQTTLFQEPTP